MASEKRHFQRSGTFMSHRMFSTSRRTSLPVLRSCLERTLLRAVRTEIDEVNTYGELAHK